MSVTEDVKGSLNVHAQTVTVHVQTVTVQTGQSLTKRIRFSRILDARTVSAS